MGDEIREGTKTPGMGDGLSEGTKTPGMGDGLSEGTKTPAGWKPGAIDTKPTFVG